MYLFCPSRGRGAEMGLSAVGTATGLCYTPSPWWSGVGSCPAHVQPLLLFLLQSTAAADETSPPPTSLSYHQFHLPKAGLPPGGNHQGDVLVQAPPRHARFTWDWLYYYIPTEEIKGMRSAVPCAWTSVSVAVSGLVCVHIIFGSLYLIRHVPVFVCV